jgi:hypothetical protein
LATTIIASSTQAQRVAFMGIDGGDIAHSNTLEFFHPRERVDSSNQLAKLADSIAGLKGDADALYAKLSIEQNKAEKLKLMDLIQSTNERLASLENQLVSMKIEAKPPKALREGQRQLNAHQLARIKKSALGACNGSSNAKELSLDAIEQIRFGSLAVKSRGTGKTMSVEFAVNTACKLIQENRWE